jgi:uncharacterized membrane protein YkvA (DUF1232 family)
MALAPRRERAGFRRRLLAMLQALRQRARLIKRDTYALYLACRDPRTPWYAKILAGAIVAYALSPIDLIPDFIPVLGYLDDIIIVPLGIVVAIRLIPASVIAECRERAQEVTDRPTNRAAAAVIIGIWAAAALFILSLVLDALHVI